MGIKKACFRLVLTIITIGGMFILPVCANSGPPVISEGAVLPGFKMGMTFSPEMMQYLGLEEGTEFTLKQIRSKLVVIEVLSALCRECHKNAPRVNKLYHIISNDSELNSNVKMIGIAVGNDKKMVDVYKNAYNVKFPIVADPEEGINNRLGKVATPSLIVADNKGMVLYFHEGVMDDMDMVLDVIRTFSAQ